VADQRDDLAGRDGQREPAQRPGVQIAQVEERAQDTV
jgi:hypothetical protein